MTREDVIEQLMAVLAETFDNDDIVYHDDLTARDVDGWDSLSKIRFMVAIEESFGVTLTIAQWESFERLGDLVDSLALSA